MVYYPSLVEKKGMSDFTEGVIKKGKNILTERNSLSKAVLTP